MTKYTDTTAIINIIGNIYKNPSLLEDEKYKFIEEYFPNEFHRIVFGAIYNLYQLGTKDISLAAIDDYLSQRPKQYGIYKTNKGQEYLEKAKEYADISTFPYYYNRIKKLTLLRMYQEKCGMDLSSLYDMDNILDVKKKQKQEDWLDNTTVEEIADIIDKKIQDIRLDYAEDFNKKSIQAGDGIDNLIDTFMTTPDFGYPMYGDYINTITRGARLKKVYMRSAATGLGKALPNDTIIPTPQGERKVKEIQPGDYLFDAFGNPTKVLEIFPQGQREVWQITFKDGRTALCSKDHLWSYCSEGQRAKSKKNRNFYTNTLEEIAKKSLYKNGHGYQILIPMQKPVEYPEKNFSVKPYTMGLLLGDGSFRYTTNQKAIMFSSENDILPNFIAEEMNWNVKKTSEFNYNWMFEWKNNQTHKNVWVEEVLKDYPDLWNAKSDQKYIPEDYFLGSISQRRDLLNGLLDSDGSVNEKGKISYYTNSIQLRNNVIKLCQSLGLKATYTEDDHRDTSTVYIVEISGTPEDKVLLFKLPRKKNLIQNWYDSPRRKESNLFNPVTEIKNLGYKTEMTCFLVDNEEHLFLMNNYIVTHNTRTMIADVCTFACNKIYNPYTRQWEDNGTKEPTLFISTEQEKAEIQSMMLCFVSGVNEDHILTGRYEEGELERVREAAAILRESPLYIEELPDFSMEDIENTIKRNIRDNGVKYVAFDYIHSSMKILSEISNKAGVKGLREDNILFMIGVRLKDLANQYEVFILTATQLNGSYTEAKEFDQNLLRGAKSLGDKIDTGLILLKATPTDLDALKTILIKQGIDTPDMKISVYKNRRGRYKDILIWCKSDRGTCRINPLFITDYQYELMDIPKTKIKIREKDFE